MVELDRFFPKEEYEARWVRVEAEMAREQNLPVLKDGIDLTTQTPMVWWD